MREEKRKGYKNKLNSNDKPKKKKKGTRGLERPPDIRPPLWVQRPAVLPHAINIAHERQPRCPIDNWNIAAGKGACSAFTANDDKSESPLIKSNKEYTYQFCDPDGVADGS
jgi:hypothetical protein